MYYVVRYTNTLHDFFSYALSGSSYAFSASLRRRLRIERGLQRLLLGVGQLVEAGLESGWVGLKRGKMVQ